LTTIERLTLVADASRITAEAAAHACTEARQVLADCQEASNRPRPQPGPVDAGAAPAPAATALAPGQPATPADPADPADAEEAAIPVGSEEPAIFRLLQGDGATLERVSDELGAGDREAAERMQRLLGALVDSVVSGAIESCVLDFPIEHAFWGDFNRGQCRDIALALASLGYRFDGLGGFADDRVPSQRDLSLAVGYAGLDPMRIRRWPGDVEMRTLYSELHVAADEYLAGRAPDLTLGEMVALLGRRSESLADLWNAWGRARPALLSTAG
ncbi:MAG TPA: hypothetical protein VFW86_06890, partial [Candidatus Limnocylindrales bacterium]|nr:hypothetical protein [Candidatus Limnocylindrales bacterium]